MFSTGVISLVFIDASVHKCRKMPSRCVVFGCSNTPDLEQGIALHRLPYADDIRPVAVERTLALGKFCEAQTRKVGAF